MIKVKLMDGKFSHQEAREILLNLIQSKITFHRMKDFSSQERFGKPDNTSVKRIAELQKVGKLLIDGIDDLYPGSELNIFSEIVIKPVLKVGSQKTKGKSSKVVKH